MIEIKILSGIPACGKTVWSRDYVKQNANTIRINRDDLRKSLINNVFTDGNENIINKVKLAIIETGIENDKNIVLDDTHCFLNYLEFLISYIRSVASQLEKEVHIELVDFNIDLDTCLDRNDNRDGQIPKHMVLHMYNEKKIIIPSNLDIDRHKIING